MLRDPTDPYGSQYGDEDPPITGGTDPNNPPSWRPGPNGFWSFVNGVWTWISSAVPNTIRNNDL